MATNYVGVGDVLNLTATGAFTKDTIYVGTNRCGVYLETGVTGDIAPIAMEGVFNLTKAAGAASNLTVLDKVWSTSTGLVINATGAGNVPLGYSLSVVATGGTACVVKLSGH